MKRYSKGYIYTRVDFSRIRQEYGNFRLPRRVRYIVVYIQIPDAGHWLNLFGPISGFVQVYRVWFSFTILSLKQGIQFHY